MLPFRLSAVRIWLGEFINNNDISCSSYEILNGKLKMICAQKESCKRFCGKNHLSFVKLACRNDNKKALNDLMMNEMNPTKLQTFSRKQIHHDNEISINSIFQHKNSFPKLFKFKPLSKESLDSICSSQY